MSVKRKSFSADFKAKLVLEALEGEKTINEIASKYEVLPVSLKNWKSSFWKICHWRLTKVQLSKSTKMKLKHFKKIKTC